MKFKFVDDDYFPKWSRNGISSVVEYKEAFEEEKILEIWELFIPHIKSEIQFKLVNNDERNFYLGQSKFGGVPHLPKEYKWPVAPDSISLTFAAQLNLEEIDVKSLDSRFPAKGLLLFFIPSNLNYTGSNKNEFDYFRVYYIENLDEILRKETPSESITLGSHSIKSIRNFSIPPLEKLELNKIENLDLGLTVLEIRNASLLSQNKLLGHSNNIQEPMEFNCEMVRQNVKFSALNQDFKNKININSKKWELLFQFKSFKEFERKYTMECMYYFWIRSEDLQNLNFSNTWLQIQHT
jgi:uncharacterized protein YwqG